MRAFVLLVAVVAVAHAQNPRARSSRFRQLASADWQGARNGNGAANPNVQPVVLNLESRAPTVPRAPTAPRPAGRRITTTTFQNQNPNLRNNGPPAPAQPQAPTVPQPRRPTPPVGPLRVPPQIAQMLGIQNLGIPGLIETGAPTPAGVQPSALDPLASPVDGNPTWAELAAQNPELIAQLRADGIANQRVLSTIGAAAQPNNLQFQQPPPTGALPVISNPTQAFAGAPTLAAATAGQNSAQNGLLSILGTLTQRLTEASGVRQLLQNAGPTLTGGAQASPANGAASTSGGPPVAGLPRLPSVALLPGGIPRDESGQIDYIRLMARLTQRVTNGTTLSDVLPPNQLQTVADNITQALLPETAKVDLTKFMGRWFEGINSPRASQQRCIVHHYGGLTDNGKTATFTALKIYREGSEFGQVRYSIGYAFRGGKHEGMLQMHTSESTDPAPFWVYKVGPEAPDQFGNAQYEYAIISNWVKYPVTVLVRDPDVFRKKYEEEVLEYMGKAGFINDLVRGLNMLADAKYDNCQYSDSTFQVFGK